MDSSDAHGGPELEAPEDEVEFLNLVAPVQGATLKLSDQPINLGTNEITSGTNLLALSNTFATLVAANNNGFAVYSLSAIRSTLDLAEPHSSSLVSPLVQVATATQADTLRFAKSDKIVVAGLRDASLGVWSLRSLVSGSVPPLHVFPPAGAALLDVRPCPAPSSPLVALLTPGAVGIVDVDTRQPVSSFSSAQLGSPTSLCWSVKGKQIVVGFSSGSLAQFTPEGEQKAVIPPPAALSSSSEQTYAAKAVDWLENNVFAVTYGKQRDPTTNEPVHEDEVYVLTKTSDGSSQVARFMDPTPAFGMMSRDGRRWTARFKSWSPFKHLLFMANAPSGDIGVLAQFESDSHWASLALPEASRPSLPLGPEGEDVCPLGLEIDLCATQPTKVTGPDGEAKDGPPSPAVYVYTSQGVLVVWRIRNDQSQQCPAMRTSLDVLTQEDQADSEPSTLSEAAPVSSDMAVTPAATPSPFGPPASSPFATGGPKPTTFGASSFGSSAFGQSSFGQSAFGAAAKTSAGPAFASSSSGSGNFSAFGSKPATTTTTPASTAAGFSAFGSGGTATGFGSVAAPSTPASAFGSGGTFGSGSAFGAAPAFGKSAFGSSSAFGQVPTSKPVIESSQPSPAPTTAKPTSGGFAGFGSAAVAGATSGFGAFAGAKAGTNIFASSGNASAASAFASVPASSSPFGSTGGSVFGSGGKAFAPSTTARSGNDSDDEDEMANDDENDQRRVDEPPDLEPTQTNLDLGASMARAKTSAETVAARSTSGPSSATTTTTTSAFGSGGTLGFGSLGFGSASTTASAPSTTSVFGSAAPATTSGPATSIGFGFGSGGSTLAPATAFSSFATPSKSEEVAPKPAFSFATLPVSSLTSVEATETKPTFSFATPPAPEALSTTPATNASAPALQKGASIPEENDVNPEKSTSSAESASTTAPTPSEAPVSLPLDSVPPIAKPDVEQESETNALAHEAKPVVTAAPQDGSESGSAIVQPEATTSTDGNEGAAEENKDKDVESLRKEDEALTPVKQEPVEHSVPAPSATSSDGPSTKSLFGFASSPPASPQVQSLLSRLGPPAPAANDQGGEEEAAAEDDGEENYEDDEEDYDEEDDRYGDEEYDQEGDEQEYGEELDDEEAEDEEEDDDDEENASDSAEQDTPAKPSLLSRFSAAPPSESAPATTSTEPSKPSLFSFASSVPAASSSTGTPATTAPAFSFSTTKSAQSAPPFGFSTPASAAAPERSAPTFSFATPATAPAEQPKPAPSFSFASTAPGKSAEGDKPAPVAAPLFGSASTAAKTSLPLAFGSTAPAETATAPKPAPSPFSFASAASTAQPIAQKPAFSFASSAQTTSTGANSAHSGSVVPPAKPAFSFAGASQSSAPAAPSAAASFPSAPPQAHSQPLFGSSAAPASSAPTLDKTKSPLSTTLVPRLGQQLAQTREPTVNETGMAGEFLKAFLRVQDDFAILKANAKSIRSFVDEIGQPCQVAGQPVKFDDRYWSMGDLSRLQEETARLEPDVKHLLENAAAQKRTVAELQSQMLKAETKREEALRFLRARSDPEFGKLVRVRQLGPEQVENQQQIRFAIESVTSRLDELEEHLVTLKEKVVADKLGRSSFKAPSLDSVNRAIRNISLAVTEKTFEIDELAVRLDLMRVKLDSPVKSRAAKLQANARQAIVQDALSSSVLRASPAGKARPAVHPGVLATASAALQAERSAVILKKALLACRPSPIVNKVACEPPRALSLHEPLSDLRAAFAAGPITGDRLPLPRRPPPPSPPALDSETASTVSTPRLESPTRPSSSMQQTAAAAPLSSQSSFGAFSASVPPNVPDSPGYGPAPPPLTFKAPISFSFATSPSASPLAAVTSGSSRTRVGTSRTHSSAVQLRPSSSTAGGSVAGPSVPKPSAFSFGDLPSAPKRDVAGFQPISFGASSTTKGHDDPGAGAGGDEGEEEGLESVSEGEEEEE
ncbi:hypothetical protein ACM66B_007077 [Microbotryomycetes sp. NB124-2]